MNKDEVLTKKDFINKIIHEYPHGHPGFVPLLIKLAELHSDKNQTYVGKADPFQNFFNVSEAVGLRPALVAWTYALKHIDAISSQLRDPRELPDDSFQERLLDVAVYCLLTILLSEESPQKDLENLPPLGMPGGTLPA